MRSEKEEADNSSMDGWLRLGCGDGTLAFQNKNKEEEEEALQQISMGSEEEALQHQLHVLFFPNMALQGHMIPMLDIAKLFSLRGVKTTFIAISHNAPYISSSSHGFNIDIITIPLDGSVGSVNLPCNKPDISLSVLQPQFEKILQQLVHPVDCIVSDVHVLWTSEVARHHGIPRIVFHARSFFYFCILDSLYHYGPHCESGDTESFVLPGLPDEITMKKSQLCERELGILKNGSRQTFRSMGSNYGFLVNSFYELEPAYADHYRKVMGIRAWHIGPVSLCNSSITNKAQRGKKAGIDEHYCLDWLNSKENNSVIYISFGSITRIGSAQLMEIAEGLEASGVSFIWVVRQQTKDVEEEKFLQGFKERMEGKGLLIRDWAPQVLILDHPAIGGYLTHCGWNSTLEGVSAGVPFITWPLCADQFYNEALITQVLKIGFNVGYEKWTEPELKCVLVTKEKIEEAVNRLMKNEEGEEMRKRAKKLKKMARRAMEEGGSSHSDLGDLIEELHESALIKQKEFIDGDLGPGKVTNPECNDQNSRSTEEKIRMLKQANGMTAQWLELGGLYH